MKLDSDHRAWLRLCRSHHITDPDKLLQALYRRRPRPRTVLRELMRAGLVERHGGGWRTTEQGTELSDGIEVQEALTRDEDELTREQLEYLNERTRQMIEKMFT